MIVLFTDFGLEDPYVGQIQAVIERYAPGVAVINLFANAPTYNPRASSHLLAAYIDDFDPGAIFLCVVDPGVGGTRRPVVLNVDGRWFVGPDNGLFSVVERRGASISRWEIVWRPERISSSFHGRDIFSPIAAWLASGAELSERLVKLPGPAASDEDDGDLAEVIYIDHFGNVMTGVRASSVSVADRVLANGRILTSATTFCEVPEGTCFWYKNANNLVELAVNKARAADFLGLKVGDSVSIDYS